MDSCVLKFALVPRIDLLLYIPMHRGCITLSTWQRSVGCYCSWQARVMPRQVIDMPFTAVISTKRHVIVRIPGRANKGRLQFVFFSLFTNFTFIPFSLSSLLAGTSALGRTLIFPPLFLTTQSLRSLSTMASKIINLLALTSLAILATSFSATPANALASRGHHLNRQDHASIARRNLRQRDGLAKRCKARPTASGNSTISASIQVAPSSSAAPVPAPSSAAPPAPSSAAPAAPSSAAPSAAPSPVSSGGNRKVGLAWPNGFTDLQYYATDAVGWYVSILINSRYPLNHRV